MDDVDHISRGRFYTASQAIELGLIDQTGGLYDAVEAAKELAGLPGEVLVVSYPKRWPFYQRFIYGVSGRFLKNPLENLQPGPYYLFPYFTVLR